MKNIKILFCVFIFLTLNGCNSQSVPDFDNENAYNYLKKQCEFGPRVPGSTGHQQCKDYLIQTLQRHADNVTPQIFMFSFGEPVRTVSATNIIAAFQPEKSERILLCAHWDTRPWADRDPNPKNIIKPVLGANDGASGVAVLLEMARLFHIQKPNVGVDIVLFDAEDAGNYGNDRSWAKGSEAFAREFRSTYFPRFGILIDMIGDAELAIYKEQFSVKYAAPVVDLVWNKAAQLGITEFIPTIKFSVFDDHIPLLENGIPCIDLIDFDYPYWHTIEDTPDKCSASSLGKVGRVLTHIIYEQK
ncbi:M28 family peptidase [candidate division KSB1 bacterium]|nr:M28 family peptidase [candidate division KSB1 bacterium]